MLQKAAPEIGAIFRRQFLCRCTTSNVIDCLRAPKAVDDVMQRHEKLASESGVEFIWCRFLEPVSGAFIRDLKTIGLPSLVRDFVLVLDWPQRCIRYTVTSNVMHYGNDKYA